MVILGCEDEYFDENEVDYRLIAYESISDEEKTSILKDWREAELIGGIYKRDMCDNEFHGQSMGRLCFFLISQEIELFENQYLVAVIFPTTNDSLLGPIIVIVDPSSRLAIGMVGRL